MSVSIKGTTIIMTRGDTLRTTVSITDANGTTYTPVEGDSVRFALKKTYNDAEPLILKDIPTDTMELRLESEDTKSLDQPGEYVYDIQITLNDGTVDTFIDKAKLKLTEEVE